MEKQNIQSLTRIIFITCAVLINLYILFQNFAPFGISLQLKGKEISQPSPQNRVIKEDVSGEVTYKQIDDLIYFSTRSEGYHQATIKISFSLDQKNQEVYVGFKDRQEWHYKIKPVYTSMFDSRLFYTITPGKTGFYAKNPNSYTDYEDFKNDPPLDQVLGIYDNEEDHSINDLADYLPSRTGIEIKPMLRGKHTFYVFLKDEPFTLSVKKRDLNWYEGEDTLDIKVYKNNELLSVKTIPDDGIADASKQLSTEQGETISYEGGFPENGVYKVELAAGGDLVITSIKTNLSRIVFKGPVFSLAGSTNIYPPELELGGPLALYSDAQHLSFKTHHIPALQTIAVNNNTIKMDSVGYEYPHYSESAYNTIWIPKGDVIVNGMGYFAFDKEQYFTPFLYKRYEIKKSEDLEKVDYLLTDYHVPIYKDGWYTAEVDYDLKDAYHTNGTLSWIIKSPGLKESGGQVRIKNIDVVLHKDALIKF